mmetsp:Transcript_69505/g.85234  ORF Transcript_69505/g.85234 Transcript_69505/m.85234 type:complete len:364 (+) Transcript_69505:27-1118(+)
MSLPDLKSSERVNLWLYKPNHAEFSIVTILGLFIGYLFICCYIACNERRKRRIVKEIYQDGGAEDLKDFLNDDNEYCFNYCNCILSGKEGGGKPDMVMIDDININDDNKYKNDSSNENNDDNININIDKVNSNLGGSQRNRVDSFSKHSKQNSNDELTEEDIRWNEITKKIDNSIKLANVDNIDDAIERLKASGPSYQDERVHYNYLLRNTIFTRMEITEYLCHPDREDIFFNGYFRLKRDKLIGKDIEGSLRHYFNVLKLRIPINSNKENKLFIAMAKQYIDNTDNIQFKGDIDDAIKIYQFCVTLNKSLHGKIAIGRSRMTQQEFINYCNDKNDNDIPGFDEYKMRSIYKSIKSQPLWVTN